MNIRPHLAYFKYLVRHKWGVLRECWKLGLYWQGIIHDLSKFSPAEWSAYAHFFYNEDGSPKDKRDGTGYYKPNDTGDPAFDMAWFWHQKKNAHHWQFWVYPIESGLRCLPMPDKYRLEMLADWKGAGWAQGTPDTKEWYVRNQGKMILHPETRKWIEEQLEIGEEATGRYQRPLFGRYKRTKRTRR